MTFCLGITVSDGLVAIADTRITSGRELLTASKMTVFEDEQGAFFLMTSGLRSVRDKTLTYFSEQLEEGGNGCNRLYKAVNAFASQLRRVELEDRASLEASGLTFDAMTLIGGQLADDEGHKLYLVYPQGNWVEVGADTPFYIIGQSGYGKPVLDRTLKHHDSLSFALKVGCLAFDSTRISAADVNFPVDVALYAKGGYSIVQHRYAQEELKDIFAWWQDRLRQSVNDLPGEWIEDIMSKLSPGQRRRIRASREA